MKEKIITTLSGVSLGAGLLLVIGTAGLSDFNEIDLKTTIIRCCIGVVLMYLGAFGLRVFDKDEIE
jgi:hypothetical protein